MSHEKPCRACMDFKSWAKSQKKTFDSEKESEKKKEESSSVNNNVKRDDCPLDKDELGSRTWSFLHTMAAYYPNNPSEEQKIDMKSFFHIFSKFYPCYVCAEDLQEQLKHCPPQTDSQKQWKDGWLDGSCD
ncbi:FAD-linked sulfhydryl oxidase ALR [Anthophora plagiata]